MTYDPPANDAVDFSESGSYSPPANDAVDFQEATDGPTVVEASATLSGSGELVADATPIIRASTTLSGAGELGATSTVRVIATATLSGAGEITSTPEVAPPTVKASTTLSGAGELGATSTVRVIATATLSGAGEITSTPEVAPPTVKASTTLSGAGEIASTSVVSVLGASTLAGAGEITSSPERVFRGSYLELVNPDDTEETVAIPYDAFSLKSSSHVREHTALNDWTATVDPRDDRLVDRVFWYVRVVHRDTQFALGRMLRVDPEYSTDRMTLEGYGRLYKMRTEPARIIYRDTPYYLAIEDALSKFDSVDSYTVVEPTPDAILNDETLVDAPASDGFDDISAEVTDTTPIDIDSTGGVETRQTCFHRDGYDRDGSDGVILNAGQLDSSFYVDDGGISGLLHDEAPTSVSYDFTTTYKMPASAISLQLRRGVSEVGTNFAGDINIYLTPEGGSETQIGQKRVEAPFDQIPIWDEIPIEASSDLPVGTHTLRIELVMLDGGGNYEIDRLAFYDDRFEYDFRGDGSGEIDANGQIAGPQLYPDAAEALLVDDALGSNIETVDVSSTFVDGEAGRWALTVGTVTLDATDGDANPSFDADANDAFGTGLQLSLELGRKGSRTSSSPTEGFEPEDLTDLVVNVTTNDLRVIQGKKDYLGTEFDVLKQLCDESRYRFRADPKADVGVIDIEAFRPEDRRSQPDLEWDDELSASVDAFDYFNAATGLGRRKVGDRIEAQRADDGEISDKGLRVEKAKAFSRAIADKAELRTELEKFLGDGVSNYNRDLSGTAWLQDIQPGGEVYVAVRGEFVPLEKVDVDFDAETMSLEFDYTGNDANTATTRTAAEETSTRESIGLDNKEDVQDAYGLDDSAFTDEDEGGEEPTQPDESTESGDFAVSITSTNSPVEEYDTVEVDATLTNNDANNDQSGTFVFSVGGERQEVRSRTVGAGESVDLTFKWQTGEGDKGDYTAQVKSGTDTDTAPITVEGFPEASGDFGVSITSTNSPRDEGETILVTADITNNDGSNAQDGTFVLSVDGTPTSYREDVSFEAAETQSLTFAWNTDEGDAGDHTAEVASGTASDSTTVTVEEPDGAADPGAWNVWIEDAPSQVSYPDGDVSVSVGVHYSGTVSTRATVQLTEDAPGSVGSTADFVETSFSPGETRTFTLVWDRVDLVDDWFVPGDVELCAEVDRDGVPGVQDSDCATVIVDNDTYVVEETTSANDTDPDAQPTSAFATISSGLEGIRYVSLSWDYNHDNNVADDDGFMSVQLGGETIELARDDDGGAFSGSGTYDFGSRLDGELELVVDDGIGSVSPP
jgi:hypothetical protein